MFVVHATRKLLDRAGKPNAEPDAESTTKLGSWYGTVLFWRPQVALFVNETTLFPVAMPLAPTATVLDRFPGALEAALRSQQIDDDFIEAELAEMDGHRLARTASCSVVGVMTDFARLAEHYRGGRGTDLAELGRRLAQVPCSPLYGTHTSPDRALAALVAGT